ncbi:DUF2782 domain-containing protein [Marinobacter halodurans]|uniref:DUF2782 domain-containing protein n=1 Tax=Marinobacter halodurans TaxID=2528979 RepID=A0ABY1ZHB9_9GAMM|nr:DUF2782 domain-containing protein [Marinobacter halodurans]TBW52208.1 DUF2782 domain-containing protein [Marinobacter halodurans]
MKKPIALLVVVAATVLSAQALAEEDQAQQQAPVRASEYKPSPDAPEVVIRPGKDATYYEYRVNGELKEIRVKPKVGPVYYLVPADDGGFIRQDGSQLVVPKWILFQW